jgi:hypothetical protein
MSLGLGGSSSTSTCTSLPTRNDCRRGARVGSDRLELGFANVAFRFTVVVAVVAVVAMAASGGDG